MSVQEPVAVVVGHHSERGFRVEIIRPEGVKVGDKLYAGAAVKVPNHSALLAELDDFVHGLDFMGTGGIETEKATEKEWQELLASVTNALNAITTERARVCPVRTEAEWRDIALEANEREGWMDGFVPAWLALVKHLNLVAEKK